MKLIRDSNETSFQFKLSKKLTFVDIQNIQLYKVVSRPVGGDDGDKEGHEDELIPHVADIKDVITYMNKYYYNKLFETESMAVGTQEIEAIRMKSFTSTRVDKGKKPNMDKAIFGFPLEYTDIISNIIRIDQQKTIKKSKDYPERFRDQDEYSFYVGFDFDFTIQTYTYVYFSTVDVISKLGGIGATIKLVITMIAPLMVLKFMVAFAQIILRKASQKVRIFRIKDIKKSIKTIREKIKEKMCQYPDD